MDLERPLGALGITLFTLFTLFAWLTLAPPARGVICALDERPAATLLLPYFEVDLDQPHGVDTLFTINNASAAAVLAHVVLWSDLSVPTLDFNVYLTGYDVQTISLRTLFSGTAPATAPAGQDPLDAISPKGLLSQDASFSSCAGQLPPPPLPASFVSHLRAAHTGRFSAILNGCAGRNLNDSIARGYVTVDTVSNCSLRFPGDAGYFVSGGQGDATNQNVLWGDYFAIDSAGNSAAGEPLVHIEASTQSSETTTPGQYTFYGRYVNWTAVDNREPLPTTYLVRYMNGGAFDGGTDLIVWRDSKVVQNPFACGPQLPLWYPLLQEAIILWDEQEQVEVESIPPFSPPPVPEEFFTVFPAEANRTKVAEELPVTRDFGWGMISLNQINALSGSQPPEDSFASQGVIVVRHEANGRYAVGHGAVHLDGPCSAIHVGTDDGGVVLH